MHPKGPRENVKYYDLHSKLILSPNIQEKEFYNA